MNPQELVSGNSGVNMAPLGSPITLSEKSSRYDPSLAASRNLSSESSSNNFVKTVYLNEGDLVNGSASFNSPFRLYIAASLEVHLGLESTSGTQKGSLGYGIKRLTADEFCNMRGGNTVVNVQQLGSEILLELSEDHAFCLTAGDIVLKINTQRRTKNK